MFRAGKRFFGIFVSIGLLLAPAAVQAAGNCVEYTGNNVEKQNYSVSASPVQSYLTTASENKLMLVQAGDGINGVAVIYYDENYKFQSSRIIPAELPLFGAFYETGDHYYLLTGQNNPNQNADMEVFRVTKYDKAWNRLSSVSLYNCNTTIPFRSGSARMDHSGKYLLIRTSHQMYESSDGLNHQANVTILVDTEKMEIADSYTGVSNYGMGYVSHSFNQFIKADGKNIVALDHGDAYPRAAVLLKYPTDFSKGKFVPKYSSSAGTKSYCTKVELLGFAGGVGNNATGASLGGFEVAENYYLAAGNSVTQDRESLNRTTRNIFVAAVDKKKNQTVMHWLTDYAEGTGTASTPHLVRVSGEKYMVLWSRDGLVCYTFVDGGGNRIDKIYQAEGKLSDCVPLAVNNKVIWYTWNRAGIVFYEIDLSKPGNIVKTERESGHEFVNKGVSNGYAGLKCKVCGITENRRVADSFNIYFNTTGEDYYNAGLKRSYKVGEKIYCLYKMLPDGSQDGIGVIADRPNAIDIEENGDYDCVLTPKMSGTINVMFYSKYNPSLNRVYMIRVEGNDLDLSMNGLYQASDRNWYCYTNGRVDNAYSGLYYDKRYGWWLVDSGRLDFTYTGFYCDKTHGWWLVGGGRVVTECTGIWGYEKYVWWLVDRGRVAFEYSGPWDDPVYGGWLIDGGAVNFDYTGTVNYNGKEYHVKDGHYE